MYGSKLSNEQKIESLIRGIRKVQGGGSLNHAECERIIEWLKELDD